jgi:hypothetical protein
MKSKLFANPFGLVYANSNDPFVPEVWAQEGLMVLYENTVAAQLVHTDFKSEVAQFGDVVNTRRPDTFTMKRKADTDNVTTQDATATNVAVKLNNWGHVSFIIYDGEQTKSMEDLFQQYLTPAMEAIAKGVEEAVLGQRFDFLGAGAGELLTDPDQDDVIDLGVKLDDLLCPDSGRNLVISPKTHGALLKVDEFKHAEKLGDDGTALREGSLGVKYNFRTHKAQNLKHIPASSVTVDDTGAVNNAAGYSAGDTTVVCDGLTSALVAGSWITINGQPVMVVSSVGGSTPTSVTFTPGLQNDVADNAVIQSHDTAAIDEATGYAADYAKTLTVDTGALAAPAGLLVSTGVTAGTLNKYGAMSGNTTSAMDVNRGLDAAVVDNALLGLGPAGSFNWAFHRNAVALISRPLALPPAGTGARSAVVNYKGLGLRVTMTYDGSAQGTRVTIDLLYGVKTLDTNLGACLFG